MLHAINIENAHEFGSVLPQLHRLRYRQFKERQSYDVPVYNGMEYDRYDTLATVHLVWLDDAGIVRGCSRLNPTDRPYMLKDLWPHMADRPLPCSPFVWEGTRICIEKELSPNLRERIKWEIVLGYLEFGLANGIAKYIGVMQNYIWGKVFIASGWGAAYLGPERLIDGIPTRAGEVAVSPEALGRVRLTTGISEPVLGNPCQIPPPARGRARMSAGALLSSRLNKGDVRSDRPPGLISRNVTVRGHRTSMRLEASMWDALNEICRRERASAADICTRVAAAKSSALTLTLTAALRVFIASYFRDAATEEGHARAGHGRETPIGALPPSTTGPTRIPGATAPGVTPAE